MNPIQTVYLNLMNEHRPEELRELQDSGKLAEEIEAILKRHKRRQKRMADEAFKRVRNQGPVVTMQETEAARREAEELTIRELEEEIRLEPEGE